MFGLGFFTLNHSTPYHCLPTSSSSSYQLLPPTQLFLPRIQSEPSAAPQGVSCDSPSSTSLRVSWKAPPADNQNGALAGYDVRYQRVSGSGAAVGTGGQGEEVKGFPIPVEQLQRLLEGLSKWTWYRITVSAFTTQGTGPDSPALLCRTSEDGECECVCV